MHGVGIGMYGSCPSHTLHCTVAGSRIVLQGHGKDYRRCVSGTSLLLCAFHVGKRGLLSLSSLAKKLEPLETHCTLSLSLLF